MKKFIFISLILLTVILSACSSKEEVVEPVSLAKYEYYTFEATCSIDWSTSRLICSTVGSTDQTTVGNLIYQRTLEGWELVDVIDSFEPTGNDLLTFIFKREIQPVQQ